MQCAQVKYLGLMMEKAALGSNPKLYQSGEMLTVSKWSWQSISLVWTSLSRTDLLEKVAKGRSSSDSKKKQFSPSQGSLAWIPTRTKSTQRASLILSGETGPWQSRSKLLKNVYIFPEITVQILEDKWIKKVVIGYRHFFMTFPVFFFLSST